MIIGIYADTIFNLYETEMISKAKTTEEKKEIASFLRDTFWEDVLNNYGNYAEIEISDDDFKEWMDIVGMTMDYHMNESFTDDYDTLYPWLVNNGKEVKVNYCEVDKYLSSIDMDNLSETGKKVIEFLREKRGD
jgi:hypothetical protein